MTENAYGMWPLVIVNAALFIAFAVSFVRPRTARDWTMLGGFSAFVVALFVEMYGVPLTIYLLSGWLGSRFDVVTLSHSSGHLWNDLIGWQWDPHISPFHLLSYVFIGGGFWVVSKAWPVLFRAVERDELATDGPYASVRHPQYAGFLAIMIGFLLQWPTIPTMVMFPVLVVVYRRLALSEERQMALRFGPQWTRYAAATPRFLPRRVREPRSSRPVRSS